MIEYMKRVRLSLLHHLSGEYPAKRVEGVRVTWDGIPVVLGPLIKQIRLNPDPAMLQMVLTVLYSTRALNLGRSPDTTTITRPCESKIADISKYARDFWRELGYRPSRKVPRDLRWKKYHFTTKSGPNGHALYTSTEDLYMLPANLVDDICNLGGDNFTQRMRSLIAGKRLIQSLGLPVEGKSFRKITWFPDVELKVRVIAIGDYWSQTVLKPLHHYLFRVLRKIPQDCTFDQGSFISKIEKWTDFYSIDLTAATDRFPIQTIKDTLKGHLPEDYLDSWERVMVGYPFDSKLGTLSYSVGNPMGFYSSWASFAVAHHYVMYYCCRELTIPYRDAKYCMLGDDVLIGDRALAEKYMEVIQSLGCEFSPLKSHTSAYLCEFAKRYVYKGVEISPFPVSALKESHKKYHLMVNLLAELTDRGWALVEGIPSTISEYYRLVDQKPSRFCKAIEVKSEACERIMKVIRGQITAKDALNSIIRNNNLPIRDLEDEESNGILQSLVVESFTESNPINHIGKGKPLGDLAITLVCRLTGLDHSETEEQLCDNPSWIPLLQAYGLVEQSYMDITKEAFRIDTVGGGDWPLYLRAMALPLDDRVFVERTSHLISRASALLGQKTLDRFKMFLEIPYIRKDFFDPSKIIKDQKS